MSDNNNTTSVNFRLPELTSRNLYAAGAGLLTFGALIEGGFSASIFTAAGLLIVYAFCQLMADI